jgi:hypothetical protein
MSYLILRNLLNYREHPTPMTKPTSHSKFVLCVRPGPYSTHGAVKRAQSKTQATINREGAAHWGKEMQKRNDYFASYKIPIVTFTDSSLSDPDACFKDMSTYLAARQPREIRLEDARNTLKSLSL